MGRIRTKDIKKASEELWTKYPEKFTPPDFESVKKEVDSLGIGMSKRVRNKMAGYITRHKKIQARGPRTFSPRYAQGPAEARS